MIGSSSLVPGTAYGVALNDARQLDALDGAFAAAPYKAPPSAAVLYIKPRSCFGFGGADTAIPTDLRQVRVAATAAVMFGRDLCRAEPDEVRAAVAGACLALDMSEPCDSFYRPAVRQQCRDGFLPLSRFSPLPRTFGEIVTEIDGVEAHRWSLDRLLRPLEPLAAELSRFMTLQAGDLLLLGLAGNAPLARPGQTVVARSAGLEDVRTTLVQEAAA